MRILDASVIVDALTATGRAGANARRLLAQEQHLHAPAILGAEAVSTVRRMMLGGVLTESRARTAARRAIQLRGRRYPFEPFLDRVWELRDNLTVYDAWYVALAEALNAPLVSADERFRQADGPRCPVLSPDEALAG